MEEKGYGKKLKVRVFFHNEYSNLDGGNTMNYRGNRWYKCDLHLHTTESKCFSDKKVTAQNWVQACLDKGLDVVAVTDHNSGNNIDQIMEAAEGTGLAVFPGVEITCDTSKIHLLILFDREKRSKDINGFLQYCGMQDHQFADQKATTGKSETIFTVAEKATERGALVIPAHIDEYNGISVASYQAMSEFLSRSDIAGVQVVNKELYRQENHSSQKLIDLLAERYPKINEELLKNWKNAIKLSREKNKAILTFSDNPSAPGETNHGLWGIGNRYTWIKMEEEVSLESLRHALLMPHQKIRNDFDCPSSPYTKPELLIKGLVVKNTILNPDNPMEIQLNPQLNTIIGGRGTGKSSVNRIFRGLLGNNDLSDFEELLEEQTNFFKKAEANNNSDVNKGIITNETVIELYLERLNHTYKVIYSNFQGAQFTKTFYKLNDEGVPEETNGSVLELFQAEIYSQKQIYHIATRPNALREKIDQSINELEKHLEEIAKIEDNYFVTTAKIRTAKNRIEKKDKIELEKNDIKERMEEFEKKGYQDTLQKQSQAESDHSIVQGVLADMEQKTIELQEFVKEFSYPEFHSYAYTPTAEEELKEHFTSNSKEFEEVTSKLSEASSVLAEVKNSLKQKIENSSWHHQYQQIKKDYNALQEELTDDELYDLSNMESLSVQLSEKEKELENIANEERELTSLDEEIKSISNSHLEQRKQITTLRRDFLRSVLAETSNIKIEVKPFRDSINFETELRKILQRTDSRFLDDFQKINALVFRGQVEQTITEFRRLIESIRDTGEDSTNFSSRFNNLIRDLNDEQMDKIRLLYPEDKIEVQYKSNDASDFKSISNASAGQKTSAILTFLLSYGNSPLLLDQPEDDLDNQLIYDLIVDRLSNSKNNRQIIVVTHNANIPVNGDSEWVMAMNSESKNIEILCEGSIENQEVKNAICSIMEGGKDAFKMRAKRYKIEI